MKENLEEISNKILETLTDDELQEKGRRAKHLHLSLFIKWTVLEVVMCVIAIYCFCITQISVGITLTISVLVCIILSTIKVKPVRFFKWDIKMWALQDIKEGATKLDKVKQINGRYIKSVSIVDRYTEISDKLHGFLNYQEIIQTRIYKFKVVFEDGGSQLFAEKENSKLCKQLLTFMEITEDD